MTNSDEYQIIRREVHVQGVVFSLSEGYGGLVVYSTSGNRGQSVHADLNGSSNNRFSANIVEKSVNGNSLFVAVFPRLKEGRYQVHGVGLNYSWANIFPGYVAEVDWR